jgi:general secretion pathway protein C
MKKVRKADPVAVAPRRPWALLLLGVAAAAGLVMIVQTAGHRRVENVPDKNKVYSSVAEQFEPMAVSSRQTAMLEPPGVAKPLHLFGVKVGGNAREGLAVLGAAESSSRTYVAGALLENGARLTELYSDHVVLTRGVQRFTLYLPQAGKRDSVDGKASASLTVGSFAPAAPPLSTPPARVSDAMRLAPVYEDERVVGYRVYAGANAGQMERWGLKEGDVLVTLAGQPLNSPDQVESVTEQLIQGALIEAEVRRGGERLPVTLDGSMLVAAATSANASAQTP